MATEKEIIEVNLLAAMNDIDAAVLFITDKDKYAEEIYHLLVCKKKIKQILNKHFDKLARRATES
jgi:hypothetical protein